MPYPFAPRSFHIARTGKKGGGFLVNTCLQSHSTQGHESCAFAVAGTYCDDKEHALQVIREVLDLMEEGE